MRTARWIMLALAGYATGVATAVAAMTWARRTR